MIQLVDKSVTCKDRTAEHIKQRASKILVNINVKNFIYVLLFVGTYARIHGALL